MKEKLQKQIDDAKKIIETLPSNNKDNRAKKKDYIQEEEDKINKVLSNVTKELKTRSEIFTNLKENKDIKNLEEELEQSLVLDKWTIYNTTYEKLHLDYHLYKLHGSYNTDLVDVNNCIRKILDIFAKAEIEIKESDFDIHPYVAKYVSMIQNHYSEEDLHNTFEQLYWKLPELINAIEINFKSIYLRNEKKIEKYFDNKHKEYLKYHSDEDLKERKAKLIRQLNETRETDKAYIFNKFVNKEYILNDYSESEIKKKKQLYFPDVDYKFDFLLEFYQVLYDYKLILTYNPYLKNLKEILNTVSTLKDVKKKALNKLLSSEKKIKKLTGKTLFNKEKNPDSYLIKFKELLHNLDDEYMEFERSCFLDTIYRHFSMDSSPKEALELVGANYLHFASILKENEENNELEFIDNKYRELKEILLTNNFVILDKISLLDEYQLKQVIVDKYGLDCVKITIEQLEPDNIDKTLSDIKTLINSEYINKSGIKLEDIKLYFEVKNLEL